MDIVTFKISEEILKKIDNNLRPFNFSNRTEFIREAIREKLNQIEKDRVIKELDKFQKAKKKRLTVKRIGRLRKRVGKKYKKKLRIKIE
jgi:Arc/MetJ-type ribon-helix-helix transcriptional regulator